MAQGVLRKLLPSSSDDRRPTDQCLPRLAPRPLRPTESDDAKGATFTSANLCALSLQRMQRALKNLPYILSEAAESDTITRVNLI